MALLESIKPYWPMIFTFVLPRALGYYRALKVAYRTRPPAKPLTAKAARSLNILFVSICFFLWLSLSKNFMWTEYRNIFAKTQSRINAPADVLFARLASLRSTPGLTSTDEELRLKLLTLPAREIYLRYGPTTTLNCPFCHPDQPLTYLLHYLPSNILLPHLLHLVTLGLATSSSLSGLNASQFRFQSIMASLVFLTLDIYVSTSIDLPVSTTNYPYPQSLYVASAIARPLLLLVIDILLAFVIYSTATGRFIFLPILVSAAEPEDTEELLAATDRTLNETALALQMAHMKLRGLNIARSTIVRDEGLKVADQRYWETVRRVEGEDGTGVVDDEIWQDEEVQAAMARAFGKGKVNVARMRKEAKAFVDNVTKGLEE